MNTITTQFNYTRSGTLKPKTTEEKITDAIGRVGWHFSAGNQWTLIDNMPLP